MTPLLLDTDTLSEVIKSRDPQVRQHARRYLEVYGRFTFSIITRYEILRGLKAKKTENIDHFQRVPHLNIISWRTP